MFSDSVRKAAKTSALGDYKSYGGRAASVPEHFTDTALMIQLTAFISFNVSDCAT